MAVDMIEVLHEEIIEGARRMGVPPNVAADLAFSVESGIRNKYSGEMSYIATMSKKRKEERNAFIFAEYMRGDPIKEIARRYDKSERRVQQILNDFGVSRET